MPRSPKNDRDGPSTQPGQAKCPVCRKASDAGRKVFPFCSQRCKLIDLGRWLGGDYGIEMPADGAGSGLSPDPLPDDLPDTEGTP